MSSLTDSNSVAPKPLARPVDRTLWGETVTDKHPWLRDASDPEVLAHLQAENDHAEAVLAPTKDLQAEIFGEIKKRVQETDLSVPVHKDGWAYYSRSEEGEPYGIHCRHELAGTAEQMTEQVFFDENHEASNGPGSESDSGYFDVGVFEVSPDHRLLLWGLDRAGDEVFDVRVRDLATGLDLDDRLTGCAAGSAWATDNRTFFYLRLDEAHRPHQVWRHELGTDQADDVLVFEEADERFWCGVGRERDDSFIQIGSSSTLSDETWLIRADEPTSSAVCVQTRTSELEYGLSHHDERFIVLTNRDAPNFHIATLAEADATSGDADAAGLWKTLLAHREEVMVTGFEVLADYLVVFERASGLSRFSVARWDALGEDPVANLEALQVVDQNEPVYSVWPGANPSPDTTLFRYGYTSMITPATLYTLDLATGERTLLKQQEVQGGYETSDYETWREWAPSHDGVLVPITLVGRRDRDTINDGKTSPGILGAYGAYEISQDPGFSVARLSLLDRGYVVGLVHARGGGELGRSWYEQGKFERKSNTFADVVGAATHLIEAGIVDQNRLGLRGGSAGGLMAGAVMNAAPELFVAVAAQVPFVDIINTMLDPSLPLTVGEWEEWGNPQESESIYRAMRTYAPLENVAAAPYPAVYATAGLTDPRVGFWEPAKWVLALREATTSGRDIVLRTDMDAGHGGMTGRYEEWRDEARTLAFLLTRTSHSRPTIS